MQTSALALDLIRTAEGFSPDAYICPAGQVTIGYGNTCWEDGEPVHLGDEIDEAGATQLLWSFVRNEVEPALGRLVKVPLQPCQRDAFASFVFNFGEAKARAYTLTRLINEQAPTAEICDWWVKYRMGGGKPLLGLYRRRLAEVLMWNGLPIEKAWTATEKTTWRELCGVPAYEPIKAEPEPVLILDKPLPMEAKVPRQMTLPDEWDKMTEKQQVAWLNTGEFIALGGKVGEPIKPAPLPEAAKPKVAVKPSKVVRPVDHVEYLDEAAKADIKVKPIMKSQRGKGVTKQELAKALGVTSMGGMAAEQIGAVEPVIKFVKAYSYSTIGTVLVIMMVFALVYYFFGKWQEQKGRDEADSLLG